MDNIDILFSGFDAEEMSEALKGIDVKEDREISSKLKKRLNVSQKSKLKAFPLKKVIPFAATFFVVFISIIVGVGVSRSPETPTTTVPPPTVTQAQSIEQKVLSALSAGNSTLVKSLILSSKDNSEKIMSLAIESLGTLSYESIRYVAQIIYEYFGSTGLDNLLESTLLGDSARALEELKKKENMLMTPLEKTAFFFSVAFCDSEVVEEFISKGFGTNLKDPAGAGLYEIAKSNHNEENMEYLKGGE